MAQGGHLLLLRTLAVTLPILAGGGAAALFLQYSSAAGLTPYAFVSAALLTLSTAWLAWGAALSLIGLWPARKRTPSAAPITGKTVILMPVCNEDPAPTFARVAAMIAALKSAPAEIDFAILSDSYKPEAIAGEVFWYNRLLEETGAEGRLFYRRRTKNTGRKAGNIADFFRRSGGAYDYALILDADSLMEAETILEMIRRIEAEPKLGLLQTLPTVVRAQSIFGRAMQFAAAFYSPVFARGLARLQGTAGPFWGHNAIVRTRAWAAACGLPELDGPPPFGGHILSHDVVEAALLARAGWAVRLDPDLGGSYEEGPESLIEHAKRDRRWCQGNLQHSRIVSAAGLLGWSRMSLVLGIMAYVAPVFWAGFLISSLLDRATVSPPDYFPDPHQFFPVFPSDETAKAIGLFIGIIGLLIMPKLLILFEAALTDRLLAFGRPFSVTVSAVADLLLSSLIAPILMAFQSRSVFQVLRGADGGWPANRRGEARLTVVEAFESCHFMVSIGLVGLFASGYWIPELLPWLVPVLGPMILAPFLIAWTSHPAKGATTFATPEERVTPNILARHDAILARWGQPDDEPLSATPTDGRGTADAYAIHARVAAAPKTRDGRIDVLRGLALVMIFINHVPGTAFEHLTNRNFGFSDAAEAFVMISGISAALAYSDGMTRRPLWPGIAKIWRRAWTLYLVHLFLSFWAIAIVFATWRFGGAITLALKDNFQHLFSDPYGVLIGVPTLGHQFGYVNILPMYAVLLLATPALLMTGSRWPLRTLAGAVALWLFAGMTRFDLPAYPLPGGWFFNPFSWQLLFVSGLLTGLAMKRGARFVPVWRPLVALCWGFVLLAVIWLKWETLGGFMNRNLGWASVNGVPWLFVAFDKTYVSLPRLLHILALAYAVSTIPGFRRFSDNPVVAPLAVMGRQALPVFAMGTVLSFVPRAVKEIVLEPSVTLDLALVMGGIVAMILFAAFLDRKRQKPVAAGTGRDLSPASA